MRRYAHYWWNVKGSYCPTRIATLDCDLLTIRNRRGEITGEQQLAAWHLAYRELRYGIPQKTGEGYGNTVASMYAGLSRLVASRENTWLVIPYAGRIFAAIEFWDRLQEGDVVLIGKDWWEERSHTRGGEDRPDGLCVIADPPTIIACQLRGKPGKFLILDSRNYGIDTFSWEGNCATRSKRLLFGLCDCLSALRQGRPVSLRCSAAAEALQILRTNYDVSCLHSGTDNECNRLARRASYGGRCECFRIGEVRQEVFNVDVRNMYPSIGLSLPVPVSVRYYHDSRKSTKQAIARHAANCIGSVQVETSKPCFPLRKWGITIYPVGKFRTTLCGPELLRALHDRNITDYYSAAQYTTSPVLSGFYQDWLERLAKARSAKQDILCQFIKAMLVGLHGKFLESGRRWIPIPFSGNMKPYAEYYVPMPDGSLIRHRDLGGYTQREETYDESYWSIPAIGSYITSAGRLRLWDYITEAGQGNVLYTDTDSLYLTRGGFDKLLRAGHIRDGEIGHLRLVGRANGCVIYGIRDVRFGDSVKSSGVPRGEIKDGESRYQYWQRQKIEAEISMGRKPGTSTAGGCVESAERYRHGTIGKDGRVHPLYVSECQWAETLSTKDV